MKIKNGILLLMAASFFSSCAYSADRAILYRSSGAEKSAVNRSGYYSSNPGSAFYAVRHVSADIQELNRLIKEDPGNDKLYADLIYELLKSNMYEEALDNLVYLNSLQQKGMLDKDTAASIHQIYGAFKRAGRRSAGLNLNLAVMSSMENDGNYTVYLSDGAFGTKNKELVKKAMRSVFSSKEDYTSAVDSCAKIKLKNPDNTEIKKIKAEFHIKLKQPKEAEKEYSDILALDSTDDDSRYELYKILASSHSADDKFIVKKLYGASPSFSYEKAYADLTELLMKHKNFKSAEKYASAMIKKYPQRPEGYLYKAEILKKDGRVKEAADVLAFARNKADSDETAAKYNVLLAQLSEEPVKEADSLIENGLYEQAIQVLDSANPASFYVILTQAKANYYAGNKDKALEHLNRAMSLFPDNSEVYCAFGAVYYKEKDTETARRYVNRSLKLNSENKTAQQLLDLINKADAEKYSMNILDEMEMQNYPEAMRLVNEALEIDSKSADLYYFKGLIYIAQNDYQASADALENCIELKKDYIDAYFYLAASLDNLSRKNEALALYKTFLDLSHGNELGRKERIDYAKLRISKIEPAAQ